MGFRVKGLGITLRGLRLRAGVGHANASHARARSFFSKFSGEQEQSESSTLNFKPILGVGLMVENGGLTHPGFHLLHLQDERTGVSEFGVYLRWSFDPRTSPTAGPWGNACLYSRVTPEREPLYRQPSRADQID